MNHLIRLFQRSFSRLAKSIVAAALAGAIVPCAWAGDGDDGYIARQAVIRLDPGMTISEFNSQYGTTTLRSIGSRKIYLVRLPVAEGQEEQWLDDLLASPPAALRWAELNYEGQDGEGRTGSFYVSDIRGRNRFNNQYSRNQLNLAGAHSMSTGTGTIVAVLDTGVDASHELMQGRMAPGGFNYVNNNTNSGDVGDGIDNDGDGDIDESHGHGTFVAGLVAMVAPDARILPIKVLDSDGHGHGFTFAAGIFRALDREADVINMSLGSTYSSQALEDALFEARQKGVIVVAAAGNLNSETEEFPAMKSDGFGVVAVNQNDIKANFSSFNQDADLSAPGVAIYSSIPENELGHTYARWQGTSMASPMVAGAAALLISHHPEWPDDHSRHALVSGTLKGSSVFIDDLNPDYERMLGDGRLDAAAALSFTEPPVAWITDSSVTIGTVISGGIPELLNDDNSALLIRSRAGFNENDPSVSEVQIGFETPAPPDDLEVELRHRLNTPGGTARLRLRNWNTGNWTTVDSHSIGVNWIDREVANLNGAPFVRQSDGRILLSVRHSVLASFGVDAFRSYVDLAEIGVD